MEQKGKAKEARANIREKVRPLANRPNNICPSLETCDPQYKLAPTPEPSDEELESSDEDEDGFKLSIFRRDLIQR